MLLASPLCRAEDQSCKPSRKQKTGSEPIWLRGRDTKVLLHNLSLEVSCGWEARGSRQSLLGGEGSSPCLGIGSDRYRVGHWERHLALKGPGPPVISPISAAQLPARPAVGVEEVIQCPLRWPQPWRLDCHHLLGMDEDERQFLCLETKYRCLVIISISLANKKGELPSLFSTPCPLTLGRLNKKFQRRFREAVRVNGSKVYLPQMRIFPFLGMISSGDQFCTTNWDMCSGKYKCASAVVNIFQPFAVSPALR